VAIAKISDMKRLTIWLSLVAILFHCGSIYARSVTKTTAGIYGYILTKTTAPTEDYGSTAYVPNCIIIIKSGLNGKIIKKSKANRYGKFTITVPPGKYSVTFTVPTASVPRGWRPESEVVAVTVWRGFYTEIKPIIVIF
jgi:hypothetical protein